MSNDLTTLFACFHPPNAGEPSYGLQELTDAFEATKLQDPTSSGANMVQQSLDEAWARVGTVCEQWDYASSAQNLLRADERNRIYIFAHLLRCFKEAVTVAAVNFGYDDVTKFIADTYTNYLGNEDYDYSPQVVDSEKLKMALGRIKALASLGFRIHPKKIEKGTESGGIKSWEVGRVQRWVGRLKMAIWHGEYDVELMEL